MNIMSRDLFKKSNQEELHGLMNETESKIKNENLDWLKHFDQYINDILVEEPLEKVNLIINKAAELADARQRMIYERFPQGI
jgi:hypothetical protein